MKHNLLYFFLTILILNSCKKEDDPVFDKSPDARIIETLNAYQDQLVNAPNGWKAYVYPVGVEVTPDNIGGFTYYMKFTNTGRVTMLADFDFETATVPRESSYRLKALQQPTLIFDTYSYIHTIADPNPNVSFGWYGRGWASDFELAFSKVTPDTIEFVGRLNKSKVILMKATAAEEQAFLAGQLEYIVESTIDYISSNNFINFTSNNVVTGVSFDYNYLVVKFTYIDNAGNVVTVNAPFSHTLNGVHFKNPVTVNGVTFQDMYWDDTKKLYYINNGGGRIEFSNASGPIIPLWRVLGVSYTAVTIPTTALPGQSALFATKYAAVKTSVKTGGFNLDLDAMTFTFNVSAKTMVLSAIMKQGANPFTFTWNYTYTMDANGRFKFTRTGQNANAALVETSMRHLLDYIENDRFTLNYFVTPTATLLGQFTSIETPAFFFTGTLK